MEFPQGVLGAALGTVILPNLSKCHARADGEAFNQTLDWALRWVLLFGLPAAVGLAVLAGPLLATAFYSAHFSVQDVDMATRSLWAFSVGLVPFMAIKVLAPGFYARQDTRTPVRIGVIAMISNMVFAVSLVFPLAHAGLALANGLSAAVNAGLLFRGLRRVGVLQLGADWPGLVARGLAANLAMGALLVYGTWGIEPWLAAGTWGRVLRLGLWIGLGGGTYFAVLFLTGIRPRHFLRAAVAGKQ
jgi:putative peptidoglycan lipid II flippase